MSKEAMKLALEALNAATRYGAGGFEDAKDALREALANEALDRMAENARELGLDYEPVCNKDPQGCWNVRCQLGKKCKNTPAQQEPVAHAVIAGALFDFMGWLTSRKERLVLSSADNASPAVEAITEFAKMRGLSLNDAKVQDWNTSPPAQKECEKCSHKKD
jgi:hypothetical protein